MARTIRAHLHPATVAELRQVPTFRATVYDAPDGTTLLRVGASRWYSVVLTDGREVAPRELRVQAQRVLPSARGVFSWPAFYRLAPLTTAKRRRLAKDALAAGNIPVALACLKAHR